MVTMNERVEKMRAIRDEVATFEGSPLADERRRNGTLPVIGEGSHEARIMFIGEAPGKNESLTGRPFCGSAGKILDELLASAEIERSSVYITNIVKDRPPANRDPLPEEIEAYAPFLDRQIETIRPEILVTLGRFSSHHIMAKFGLEGMIAPISSIRGRVFNANGIKIVPIFHPASAIYDRSKMRSLLEDFQKLKKI